MSIIEHLKELRDRLLISLGAIAFTTIFGFLWYQHGIPAISSIGFPGSPSLGEILKEPYCSLPASARASLAADGQCRLLATSPFEMFMLRLKVGAMAGVILACPVWLIQLWRFITPGLLKNERRWTLSIGIIASLLFVAGAIAAYWVLPYGMSVLLTIGDQTQIAALSGHEYFTFVVQLILIFGVSFEVPLFTAMLNIAGVVHYEQLKDKRRIIIVILFIFAAFATPGQDPISMLVLACALTLLMELALQFTRIYDKRRNRKTPSWASDISDDEASPLDPGSADGFSAASASPVYSSAPIGSPDPIKPAHLDTFSPQPAGTSVQPSSIEISGTPQASSIESPSGGIQSSQGVSPSSIPTPSSLESDSQGDPGTVQNSRFDDVL